MTDKLDVYSRVTNKIVADLERENLTWLQPWQAGHQAGPVSRPLRAGGKAYRGVNVLMLWAAAMERGYSCPLWLTYKQAAELGGQCAKVKKARSLSRPEVTERAFLTHKRTDREHDGAIARGNPPK